MSHAFHRMQPGARRTLRIRPPGLRRSLVLLACLLLPATLSGQSAAQILQSVADRYEERLEGIDDYTVVQEVMGMSTTTYFERGPDGEFNGRIVDGPGASTGSSFAPNSMSDFEEMAEVATYEGTESVDGHEVHVIRVEDFSAFEEYMDSQEMGAGQGKMNPESMVTWIDVERLVPLRMEMHGTMTMNGRSGPVTSTVQMEDYREIEGMLHPCRTRIETTGMAELMDISPEQLAQLRQQMEEMRSQMDRMPAAQREMMQRMMGEQLERVEQMMNSGAMDMTVTVTELRVNAGPPGG